MKNNKIPGLRYALTFKLMFKYFFLLEILYQNFGCSKVCLTSTKDEQKLDNFFTLESLSELFVMLMAMNKNDNIPTKLYLTGKDTFTAL